MANESRRGSVHITAPWSRRRSHSEVPRRRRITVRYTDAEYGQVLANAAVSRMAPAAYLAQTGLRPVHIPGQDPANAGVTDRDDIRRALLLELMGIHRQMRGAATNLNQAVAKLHATGAPAGELPAVAEYVRRVTVAVDDTIAAVTKSR